MAEYVAALPEEVCNRAQEQLLRADGQEDLCFALYNPSTGRERQTALVYDLIPPMLGDRVVHGNVSFDSKYIRRALARAEREKAGLAFMHSHPLGRGWQDMSRDDVAAEQGHAAVVYAVTRAPFLGLTVAADGRWSGRLWLPTKAHGYERADCSSVRVVGKRLCITHHPSMGRDATTKQLRTLSFWGDQAHRDFTGLSIAVVGLGSVGSIVAESLARIGVQRLTLIDHDTVREHNLDRTLGASSADVKANLPKVQVAARSLALSATADAFQVEPVNDSVVEESGFRAVLDCDAAFSCVDRPWARHVLNTVAFAHLVPVVDGGIIARFHERTREFLGANWAVQTVAPGRPCLLCRGAYDLASVSLEQTGLLDDVSYVSGLPEGSPLKRRENIFPLSLGVASFEVIQLVAMVSNLMGLSDLEQQRYSYYPGVVRIESLTGCRPDCPYPNLVCQGDRAPTVTGRDPSKRVQE